MAFIAIAPRWRHLADANCTAGPLDRRRSCSVSVLVVCVSGEVVAVCMRLGIPLETLVHSVLTDICTKQFAEVCMGGLAEPHATGGLDAGSGGKVVDVGKLTGCGGRGLEPRG